MLLLYPHYDYTSVALPSKFHLHLNNADLPMIGSRVDYLAYLEADRIAMGRSRKPPLLLVQDPTWYYLRLLRKHEFYINCRRSSWWWPLRKWVMYRYLSVSLLLGFQIPPNTIGPGLDLVHTGDILVNDKVRIGSNLRMNIGVTIGEGPQIGSHVTIEPGAKIFGDITIADWTHIGANAVLNKSVTEPGMIVVGVPAQIVKPNPLYPGND
jgi:serine O-acetyltransferase